MQLPLLLDCWCHDRHPAGNQKTAHYSRTGRVRRQLLGPDRNIGPPVGTLPQAGRGADLYEELPVLQAELAESLVLDGDLERAEKALDKGFSLDPSEPRLWVNKARFQLASGLPQLAQASVNYALAIWKDADPDYADYMKARELEQEIIQSISGP